MNLYLFDFDGTLYKKDSMLEFVKFLHKNLLKYHFINFLFSPFYVLNQFNIISTQKYKTIFLKMHFFNYSKSILNKNSKLFVKYCLEDLYLDVLSFLKNIDGEKCIVTASLDIWMNEISKSLDIELVCTKSVFKNKNFYDILTNCNEKEKVKRITQKYILADYDNVYVFGNSTGDKEMYKLGIMKHDFFKNNETKK